MDSGATAIEVHPTALVEAGARIGAGSKIHAHAIIKSGCDLGEQVVVHPFAVIGGDPQDLHFESDTSSGVRVGPRTVIREHVTINRATRGGGYTEVGADCFLMAACHVAHDCRVGDRVIIANAVLLGGHVQVGDRTFIGGGAVVHQFCRIGEGAMIGGGGRISQDVAPYCMATERNALIGLNLVGLRRQGMKRDVLRELKGAFRLVNAPLANPRDTAADALQREVFRSAEARRFLEFFQTGKRSFVRIRALADDAPDGT